MKNTQTVEFPIAFLNTPPGVVSLKALNDWEDQNPEVAEANSLLTERLAKQEKTATKHIEGGVGKRIFAALTGEDVALTPEQIVTNINNTLRKEGTGESTSVRQVNCFLNMQGIRTETKPHGLLHKEGKTGKVSFIDQPDEETPEPPKSTPKSKNK